MAFSTRLIYFRLAYNICLFYDNIFSFQVTFKWNFMLLRVILSHCSRIIEFFSQFSKWNKKQKKKNSHHSCPSKYMYMKSMWWILFWLEFRQYFSIMIFVFVQCFISPLQWLKTKTYNFKSIKYVNRHFTSSQFNEHKKSIQLKQRKITKF